MDASPSGMTAILNDLPQNKTKQEKGEALLARLSVPQMPAVRAFSGVSDRGRWNAPSRGCGTRLTLQIEKSQCLQGVAPTLQRNPSAILTDFGPIKPEIHCKNLLKKAVAISRKVW